RAPWAQLGDTPRPFPIGGPIGDTHRTHPLKVHDRRVSRPAIDGSDLARLVGVPDCDQRPSWGQDFGTPIKSPPTWGDARMWGHPPVPFQSGTPTKPTL